MPFLDALINHLHYHFQVPSQIDFNVNLRNSMTSVDILAFAFSKTEVAFDARTLQLLEGGHDLRPCQLLLSALNK